LITKRGQCNKPAIYKSIKSLRALAGQGCECEAFPDRSAEALRRALNPATEKITVHLRLLKDWIDTSVWIA